MQGKQAHGSRMTRHVFMCTAGSQIMHDTKFQSLDASAGEALHNGKQDAAAMHGSTFRQVAVTGCMPPANATKSHEQLNMILDSTC